MKRKQEQLSPDRNPEMFRREDCCQEQKGPMVLTYLQDFLWLSKHRQSRDRGPEGRRVAASLAALFLSVYNPTDRMKTTTCRQVFQFSAHPKEEGGGGGEGGHL